MSSNMFAPGPSVRQSSTQEFDSAIESLVSSFKNGLTKYEQDEIESVSLGDLNEAIKKIQEKQRATRTYRNLNRIGPFVTGMTAYGRVIAVFANAVPAVAFVWVKIASSYTDAFDLVLDAYKDIGNNLPQFEKYAQLFGDKPSVRKALVDVFEVILNFHKQAMKFFRRSAWKTLFRASWDGFRGRFAEILTELKKHQTLLEKEGQLANFENMNFMIKDLEKRDEENQRRQLVEVYRWLSAADYSTDHSHMLALRNGFPGTSMWLLERNDMVSWLDSSSEVLVFWFHGILGSGKTVAASCVAKDLVTKSQGLSSLSVAYFYCKQGDASRDTCGGIFRAILAQLLEQNLDIVPYFNTHKLALTHDPLKSSGLRSLVETVFKVLDLVYLVIDGLDEIDRRERAEFFGIILPLLKSQLNKDVGYRMKLFISSRREDDIEANLSSIGRTRRKSYEITGGDNHKDIVLYVSLRVQELQKKFGFDDTRREEISKDVCSRAGVMFLLPKLILDNLMNQTNLEELEDELRPGILPSELRDAYGRIFQHLNKYLGAKKQSKSREILGLIGFSKRALKTNDIQGALSINTSNRTLDYKARCLKPDGASVIRELCSVIVEVRSDQSVVFVHATARQFIRELYISDPACQNFRLTDLCLTYLTFDCLKFDLGDDEVRQSIINGDYAFLEYAANNWLKHLRDLKFDRKHLGPEQFSDICGKTKAVLDFYQRSRAHDYTPAADLASYFRAFSDRPDVYFHPTLRGKADLNQGSAEDFTDDSASTNPHPQPFLAASQLLRTRKALEQVVASHGAVDTAFLRECYGPIPFKCNVIGCLRYGFGFETQEERDGHVKSHNRPSKCPERGCFYGEVGFANQRTLNQHISLCHRDPVSNRFVFPKLGKPPVLALDERERFRAAIKRENLDLLREMIDTNGSLRGQLSLGSYTGLGYAARFGKLNSIQCLLECGCSIAAVTGSGTALHAACQAGKTNVVQFLLSISSSEHMNAKDRHGRTPLSLVAASCYRNTVPVFMMLLEHDGIEVDAKDKKGRTTLSLAAARKHSEPLVKLLLGQAKIDVDAKDNGGRTPLSWAASEGAVGVVKLFLEHATGIDVNARDNEGMTPLSWAASKGTVGVVKLFLEQGMRVDVNATDNEGMTPLLWAARKGAVGVIKLFLEQGMGVDMNAKDNEGRTPLSWAASRSKWDEKLVPVDNEGMTPQSWAAREGAVDVVKLFLQHGVGVDVNAKDNKGRTPLSRATSRSKWDEELIPVVKLLLGQDRVDVDAKDNEGRTPLSRAASKGAVDVVKLFLEEDRGVDVNATDNEGMTPLSWAATEGAVDVVKLFLEQGIGVDVNAKDNEGMTPLSWAAVMGTVDMVELFLEQGMRVDVNAKDKRGMTPLSWAAAKGAVDVVKLFLEQGMGVDVNSKNNEGMTPLSLAAKKGIVDVVELLLEQDMGVDVNTKDKRGMTPLSWAASTGSAGAVKMLLEHGVGVDVNAKDKTGRTPLSWATARDNREKEQIVRALVEHGGIDGAL